MLTGLNFTLFYKIRRELNQIIMGLLLFVMIIGMFIYGQINGVDFNVYYLAGKRFLLDQPIYQAIDGGSPFKYHPSWAIVFSLFSRLPYFAANLIFNCINLFFWISTVKIWARWLNYKMNLTNWTLLLLISINALSTEIGFGQLNGFLIWGVTWLFLQLDEKPNNYLLMGMLILVMITLKLNYALVLVYFLMRQWRIIWGILTGVFILYLLTIFGFRELWPANIYREWLHLLLTQSADLYNTYEVQGVLRFLLRHFEKTSAQWFWLCLLFLMVGGGLLYNKLRNKNNLSTAINVNYERALEASYWLALIFLFSPLTWWYHVLLLYPLVFVLLKLELPIQFKGTVYSVLFIFSCLSYNTVGKENLIFLKESMVFFACSGALITLLFIAVLNTRLKSTILG